MARYLLGVDGGQSSTTALIGDANGRVIGVGRGGPCNHVAGAAARAKFLDAIGGSIRAACQQAGIEPRFEAACLGFSGGPEDKRALVAELVSAARLEVTDDALIALAGATAGQPGIISIAGTGSIAFGRNAKGRTGRAGGWGYIFGDEGGAFDIVRKALQAALRCEEGWGEPTALRDRFLAETGAASMNAVLHLFYTPEYPRSRVARFAPMVDAAAAAGDAAAARVMREALGALVNITSAVRHMLFENGEHVRCCYIGGVFRSEWLLARFQDEMRKAGCVVGPPEYGPAAGALIEAYRLAGFTPPLTDVPEFEK
jgi:N-acetylglucosamine kinase-like BadF-type ATPase